MTTQDIPREYERALNHLARSILNGDIQVEQGTMERNVDEIHVKNEGVGYAIRGTNIHVSGYLTDDPVEFTIEINEPI